MKRRVLGPAVTVLLMLASGLAGQTPADSAWDAGDIARARELYAARLARDSSDIRALHRLALIHGWSQEYDESLALFDRLLELFPANLDARVDRTRVFAWKGDIARAIGEIEELLESDPTYRPALEALATFRSWAGEFEQALSLYDRISRFDPDDPTIHYERARVLGWADRFDAARVVYDSLLAANPDDVRALLGLGQILMWSDQLDSARVVYRRVLALDRGNRDALTSLARAASWSGDLVEGERRWRAIVASDPQSADALVGLGRTLRWQGREAAAKPFIQRALELSPGNTEARAQMRWIHAALGPRVAPTVAYEWDSDGNRILTTSGHAAWHPAARLDLRLDLYYRSARLVDIIDDARGSRGGTLTTQVQLAPGWKLAASGGVGVPSLAGVEGTATYGLTVATPPRHRVRGALVVGRELLDATAVLMANRVAYDQVSLNLGTRLGSWAVEGAASVAWFESLVTANGNRRLAANAVATRRVTPWLDLGPSLRIFGFDADLTEGYFDSELFALLEAPASFSTRLGALDASLGLVPGLQKIRFDGPLKGAFRTTGRLAWQAGPGRHLSLSALYAANGASPFADQVVDYRYFALNVRARWVF